MPNEEQAAVAAVDANAVLAELLSAVQELKADRDRDKAEFARDKATLEAQLAAQKAEPADPYRPAVAPPGMINIAGDGPELDFEKKLDGMEAVAEYNGVAFNRERVRCSLLGLPYAEDPIEFFFNGRVFESQAEMDAYVARMEHEKERTLGKYPR